MGVVVLLGGCSSVPDITAAAAATSVACARATELLPATVGTQSRREVSAAGSGAWGDPAIIARCGVRAAAPTQEGCVEVDGVGWIPDELTDGTRFTTFGTDPALEVLVPASYRPGTLLLPAFTKAATALPTNGLLCR